MELSNSQLPPASAPTSPETSPTPCSAKQPSNSQLSQRQSGPELNSQLISPPARLPDEPADAYNAFVHYYRLQRTTTQAEIAKLLGVRPQKISEYKKKWDWESRLTNHLMPIVAIPDHSGDWPGKHDEVHSAEWQVHLETLQAGREALVRWRNSTKIPSLAEITRVLEISLRLARLASGLPLNYTEITAEQTSHIHIDFEAALNRVYGPPPAAAEEVIDVPQEASESESPKDV